MQNIIYIFIVFTMSTIKRLEISDEKKVNYFAKQARGMKSLVAIHQKELWEANRFWPRDWDNVTKHCLVEVARVNILADMLDISQHITYKLRKAAMLHDFHKKHEKNIVTNVKYPNPTREAFDESKKHEKELIDLLYKDVIDADTYYFVDAVWHTSLVDTRKILEKAMQTELSAKEKAYLIMHYVDDYTRDDKWTEGVSVEEGKETNDFDLRMQQNKAHPRYQTLNEDGITIFGNKTFDEQEAVWHEVEEYLYNQIIKSPKYWSLLADKSQKYLPTIVDDILASEIHDSNN